MATRYPPTGHRAHRSRPNHLCAGCRPSKRRRGDSGWGGRARAAGAIRIVARASGKRPSASGANLSRSSGRPGHRDHAVGRNEYWPSRWHLIDRHRGDRVSRGQWAVFSTERSAAGNCPGRRVPRSSVCGGAPGRSPGHRQRNGPTSLRRFSSASHRYCRGYYRAVRERPRAGHRFANSGRGSGRGARAVTAVLELRSVGKTYPPPTAVTALAKVDLTVGLGETVSITGPSGSGKSTLLNVLGTLERPSTGTVRIGGTDTSTIPDRQLSGLRAWRIGFVFQEFHLLEHLTVLDNVATGLIYRGLSVRSRRDAAASALRRVGLGSRVTHRPSRLSGGERQRAAIARAIAGEPQIILADEPTGNLDSATGAEIIRLIAGLAGPRTTVIVITHDIAVAAVMRRAVRLHDGRIV